MLQAPQCAHQGEQCCFAATRRARQQHHFAWIHAEVDVLQHLTPHRAGAVAVADVLSNDRRWIGHQKISAGSASANLRIATKAEPRHITKIMVNTSSARCSDMPTGSWVEPRIRAYSPSPAA